MTDGISDGKRARALRHSPKPTIAKPGRSRGFAHSDQRLPASPPLDTPDASSRGGIMAAVRARYRDAVSLLFGTPPRVLNTPCIPSTVASNPLPHSACFRHPLRDLPDAFPPAFANHPTHQSSSLSNHSDESSSSPTARAPCPPVAKRKRDPARAREPVHAPDTDQVVPGQLAQHVAPVVTDIPCHPQGQCACAHKLWTSGGVGPGLMLRTAEELSESIAMLYRKAVDNETGDVNYSSLVHSPDFYHYLASARKLRYFDPLLLNTIERKAFFLNVYNSLMIHAIAVMSKPRTMFERISLYNTASYDIGGRPYSLNAIEHGVLRSNRRGSGPFAQAQFAETDARRQCMLPTVDPRIHFALNCGARSCPPVRFYEANTMNQTLDTATRAYLQDVDVDYDKRVITLPKLLQWYQVDFCDDGNVTSTIRWILPYLDADRRDRISSLLAEKDEQNLNYRVVYAGYDWTVNDSSL